MNKRAAWWLLCFLLAPFLSHAAVQVIPLTTLLNGQDVGELNASIENEQLRALDISPIRQRLERLLTPSADGILKSNTQPSVLVSDLESAGIATRFDFQNLRVLLVIPTEVRRSQEINLLPEPNFNAARTVPPSDFSAY